MASGNSCGQVSSFHSRGWGGVWIGFGTNLFQPFGKVPPGTPTAPRSAFSRKSVRETCQPPRLPAAALRQAWVLSRGPASATTSATSSMTAAPTPDSRSAKAKVYSA